MVTLFKDSPTGKQLIWEAKVIESTLKIQYGATSDKLIETEVRLASPSDAQKELEQRTLRKIDREGYYREGEKKQRLDPMLAVPFQDVLFIDLPDRVAIQPKLDGIRCIATSEELLSRRDKRITSTPHIKPALNLPPGVVLDGELRVDGEDFDQQLEYINRQTKHKFFYRIKYHVFDIISDEPFHLRFAKLIQLSDRFNPDYIKLVRTEYIFKSEIEMFHNEFVDAGHEGSIIRNPVGLYQPGTRTKDLLKKKDEFDCHATITDIVSGIDGKEADCAIFVCQLENGVEVRARPKMSLDKRRLLFRNKDAYLGKKTEIRHYGVNKSGQLRQARAYGVFE